VNREVFVAGVGQVRVGERWALGLRELGAQALRAALDDARLETVDALCVGNMMGGGLNGQENVATLVADASGLRHAEAWKVEAACASGAAAVRSAALAVASGAHEVVAAVGVEKMTDGAPEAVTSGLATASDQDYEASHGLSFVALAALLMRRYLHETGRDREAFAPFAVEAHRNAATNEHAMFRDPITAAQFARSPMVASPIGLLDAAPICDGAAAVVLCSRGALRPGQRAIRIAASAGATDTIDLASRPDILTLGAAQVSARRAFEAARCGPDDVHFFEAHDAFTIMSVLSLEACGFARRGQALELAAEGVFTREGRWPLSTFGGLKARGHPVGASGAYQIVEAVLQLRGDAGANQVRGATRALTQSIGGHGSVVVTHVLEG
jgi:acetyl-CoA C-acetyltransferase